MKIPSNLFESESNWLKAADHPDMNRRVKIAEVGQDTLMDDESGEKDIVWVRFERADKPIILSKTNGNALLAAFGEETDDWIGKECQLTTKKYVRLNSIGWIITPLKDSDPDDDIPF